MGLSLLSRNFILDNLSLLKYFSLSFPAIHFTLFSGLDCRMQLHYLPEAVYHNLASHTMTGKENIFEDESNPRSRRFRFSGPSRHRANPREEKNRGH
jgi:hypothetical protein